MYNITMWRIHITSQMCQHSHTTSFLWCSSYKTMFAVTVPSLNTVDLYFAHQYWNHCQELVTIYYFCIVVIHITVSHACMAILCRWQQQNIPKCKIFLSNFNKVWRYLTGQYKKSRKSYFMKIHPVKAELI